MQNDARAACDGRAYEHLQTTYEALDHVTLNPERDQPHNAPEQQGLLDQFQAAAALQAASHSQPEEPLTISLTEHRAVLLKAIRAAALTEQHLTEELPDTAPRRQQAQQTITALRQLSTQIKTQDSRPPVEDLYLQRLLILAVLTPRHPKAAPTPNSTRPSTTTPPKTSTTPPTTSRLLVSCVPPATASKPRRRCSALTISTSSASNARQTSRQPVRRPTLTIPISRQALADPARHGTLRPGAMPENPHVTLAGDLNGDYLIEQELPDGRLLLRPNPTQPLAAFAGRPATPQEFQQLLAGLSTDNEG